MLGRGAGAKQRKLKTLISQNRMGFKTGEFLEAGLPFDIPRSLLRKREERRATSSAQKDFENNHRQFGGGAAEVKTAK